MDSQKLITLIKSPETILTSEIKELENLALSYPYAQCIHALVAKGHKNLSTPNAIAELHHAAIYTTNRKVLKRFIQDESHAQQPIKETPAAFETSDQIQDTSSFTDNTSSENIEPSFTTEAYHLESEEEEKTTDPVHYLSEETQQTDVIETQTHDDSDTSLIDNQIHETEEVDSEGEGSTEEESITFIQQQEESFNTDTTDALANDEEDETSALLKEIQANMASLKNKMYQFEDEPIDKTEDKEKKKEAKKKSSKSSQKKKKTEEPQEKKLDLDEQKEIIDEFIKKTDQENDTLRKPIPDEDSFTQEDLASESSVDDLGEELVSENLAVILEKQGKIEKAIDIYKKLIWKYPQKRAYFVSKIEELKK